MAQRGGFKPDRFVEMHVKEVRHCQHCQGSLGSLRLHPPRRGSGDDAEWAAKGYNWHFVCPVAGGKTYIKAKE